MTARADQNPIIIPPPAPYRFWMTDAIAPLQAKMDAGEELTSDETAEYCRLRGREDLFFFAKYCFGFDHLEAPLHSDLAYAWQAPNGTIGAGRIYTSTRKAQLARTNLKTTLCTQAYSAWRLVRNPEERGLIYTHSYGFGVKILSLIKSRFEGHGTHGKWFLALYGELIPPKREREKWTENMLTVRRQGSYTDASLEASGIGGTVTGGHFTFQCVDDLQGKKEPPTQIAKIKDGFDNLTPMLLAGGDRRIVDTRWGFNDVSHHIERAHPRCMVARRRWKENGKLVYSRTDEADVEALFRTNKFLASCWFDNNPRADDKDGFQESWFRRYDLVGDRIFELDAEDKRTREIPLASCNVFAFVDPNTGRTTGDGQSQTRGNDRLGLVILAVGPDNTWYVLRAYEEDWTVEQTVDSVFSLDDYYHAKFWALEQRAAQILFRHIFQTEFKRRNRFLTIIDWKGGAASKEERIKGLAPRYANGMIFHRANGNDTIRAEMARLEQELLDFPTALYDDVTDALSAAGPLAYAPGQTARHQLVALDAKAAKRLTLDRGSARAARVSDSRAPASEFFH